MKGSGYSCLSYWFRVRGCVAAVLILGSSQSSIVAGNEPGSAVGPDDKSQPGTIASARSGRPLMIAGEPFSIRQIIDKEQGGLTVSAFSAPEKWKDKSQVMWNYQHVSSPVQIMANAENPANEEAFFLFPVLQFFSLRPDANYYRAGQNYGGLIFVHQPMSPAQMLQGFVQQARSRFPKFQLIGGKELPDLAKALNYPMWGNDRGVGMKITYELNGKLVEEEFYGVAYSVDIPYDGPQGRTWQINWGLRCLHSFRAPQGGLDGRREVFAAIAKSFKPNPGWQQRLTAVNAYLTEQFNRQLQAGYDSIAAAGRLSKQISANNDAMIASIDRQLAASRASGGVTTGSGGRSSTDHFDDYIRGVDTVDDPYRGTSQHSFNDQFHWTDGYGTYRNSNDANYNPNQHENGDWHLMQPSR